MRTSLYSLLSVGALTVSTNAIPSLQLDITGGTYDGTSETTLASSSSFSLVALLQPDKNLGLGTTYYISAAIEPQIGVSPAPDFGSFSFAGVTVDHLTSGLVLGRPSGMPPHSGFDTYYKSFSFTFDGLKQVKGYDVQTSSDAHKDPTSLGGTGSYYSTFAVDVSDLKPGYTVHFDLYAYYDKKGELAFDKAPFSHDAESIPNTPPPEGHVPDGGATLALLGLGFIAVEGLRRKLS